MTLHQAKSMNCYRERQGLPRLPAHFMKTVIEGPLVSQLGIGLMTKKCYDKLTYIPMFVQW